MPTTRPAEILAAWQGKRLETMSRLELIQALQDLWRSYNAVNRRTVGAHALDPMPAHDWDDLTDTLKSWFG